MHVSQPFSDFAISACERINPDRIQVQPGLTGPCEKSMCVAVEGGGTRSMN